VANRRQFHRRRFDGAPVTILPANASTGQPREAIWGSVSSADKGQMNFHRVEFDITGLGAIATYDAGFEGNPAVAPDPLTQAWARSAPGGTVGESPISPDTVNVQPLVLTEPENGLWPGAASLVASVNPNGRPAAVWFEYGLTTNYGSFSATNGLAAGTDFVSVSNLVLGLALGVPCHVRAVAAAGTNVAAGADMGFDVPVGATGFTDPTGGGHPFDTRQPSLAVKYMIATIGDVPSPTVYTTNRMVGQIDLYAGSAAVAGVEVPGGWVLCNGQLLGIATNAVLFAVIGTSFGGDGLTTFAVPNLSGRIPVGSPNGQPGAEYGSETITFTLAQLPPHMHTVNLGYTFDYWAQTFGLTGPAAAFGADPDGDGADNGYEWATGTDPTNAQAFEALSIGTAGSRATIHFQRNVFATDITLALQRATALGGADPWGVIATNHGGVWSAAGIVRESGPGPTMNVEVTDDLTNDPAANYRLRITKP
jgi:microcystin-dependent protein